MLSSTPGPYVCVRPAAARRLRLAGLCVHASAVLVAPLLNVSLRSTVATLAGPPVGLVRVSRLGYDVGAAAGRPLAAHLGAQG